MWHAPRRIGALVLTTAAIVVAVWIGAYLRSAVSAGIPASFITVRGEVRQFDGPLLGPATRCRNVLPLANEPVSVFDGDGTLLGETWVTNVSVVETNEGRVWTCRQEGTFRLRVAVTDRYRFVLDGVPVQPTDVPGDGLRAHGGVYSMVFSVLDPSGDVAVGCFAASATSCAL